MSRQKTMVTLLPELITEILLWLPVKSLLRFRCVSKSFCNVIDSSYFIMEHVKRSMETRSHLKLIILDHFEERPQWMPESYHPTVILEVDLDKEVKQLKWLNNPVRPDTCICGSCNGLFLLFADDKMFVDDDRLALWNAYTRQCKELPVRPIEILHEPAFRRKSHFGLGYDSSSDDHKVVCISEILRPNNVNLAVQVWIFGLRSNTWRRLPEFPYTGYEIVSHGYFANGALHWLLKRDRNLPPQLSEMNAAFDMANETFFWITPPVYTTEGSSIHLNVLEGCLSVGLFSYKRDEVAWYVRKKHGDGFSWIELFRQGDVHWEHPTLLAYSKRGNKVLMEKNYMEIIWYDLKEKTCEIFEIPVLPIRYSAVVSLETLVSLGDDSKFDGNSLWGELRGEWEIDGQPPDDWEAGPPPDAWEFGGGLDNLLGFDGLD